MTEIKYFLVKFLLQAYIFNYGFLFLKDLDRLSYLKRVYFHQFVSNTDT